MKHRGRPRTVADMDRLLKQQDREIEQLKRQIKDLRIKRAKPIKQTIPQLNAENARLNARIAQLERETYDGYYEARVELDKFAREMSPLVDRISNRLDKLIAGPFPLVSNKPSSFAPRGASEAAEE